MDERFVRVGIRPMPAVRPKRAARLAGFPLISGLLLLAIVLGCLCCDAFIPKDPAYMDLSHVVEPPGAEFWFGTDTMGRDMFSMIWHGGRVSLFIGALSTLISTAIAIAFGSASGLAPKWLDGLMMRAVEIVLSIPGLLLIVFIQALFPQPGARSISLVIGVTSWMSVAKVVRSEVRQLRNSGYVTAARCMGAGFFRVLWRHLTPNFFSSILFMVVMNIRSAIAAESTLSFMGLGLPLETVSWGGLLSLSERAMNTGAWWIMVIPGAFLTVALLCVTNVGNWLREQMEQGENGL